MHRNLPKKGKITAAFIAMLLVTTFTASLLPEVTAAEITISIEPEVGYVEDTLRVNGTIKTLNGNYTIFFDEEPVKSGNATNNEVDDTFTVPDRPANNYTVTLHDVEANENATAVFTLETAYYINAVLPPPPKQLQEFNSTEIWVNVTGGEAHTVYFANVTVKEPSPAKSTYWTTVSLTNTTTTGYGERSITYPADFSAGAHTNYTGIYSIAFNGTLATGNFTLGLTNATEYHRFQVVSIQAANYTRPNEYAWVNMTFAKKIFFSENVSAVGGMIKTSWEIPGNASMGLYTVNITSSITNGTVKPVLDTQNFTIVKIPCQILTKKLNDKVLADAKVDVYNATESMVASTKTDEDGLTSVLVEGGNYTFEASWEIKTAVYVSVGTLVNQSIKEEPSEPLILWCWVAYLNISISPPLPFIKVTLTYHDIIDSFETNRTGIWKIPKNMPTNTSYTIEARRYGYPFYNETLEKLPAAMNVSWVNVTITVPTYTMFVHVLDSKDLPIQNVNLDVIEWSSGILVYRKTTNPLGSETFSCTFGRYKVRVYNYSALLGSTVVLNETVIDLIEDQFFLPIYCKIYKVDLSLSVIDYFGQPIPNAVIKVERDGLEFASLTTGKDGTTPLHGIIGGNCRFSVHILGKLCETRTLFLDRDKEIAFKIDGYIVVGGYPLEIVQFIAFVSLSIMVAIFALGLAYRRISVTRVKKKEEESTAQKE